MLDVLFGEAYFKLSTFVDASSSPRYPSIFFIMFENICGIMIMIILNLTINDSNLTFQNSKAASRLQTKHNR